MVFLMPVQRRLQQPSLCTLLTFCLCVSASAAYKDVVFMHGILSGPWEWTYFTQLIQQYHPGTNVYAVNMYDRIGSITRLWDQVEHISEKLRPILTNTSSEGTLLVSYSQGGIVSRGILSVLEHNVETFISLSGPLAGQFGDTAYLEFLFPTFIRDNIYELFYSDEGQETSVGNYWIDPHHQDLYRKYSQYLGFLNNETVFLNPQSEEFRANFLRLKNLVLLGGPDDGVITPWQSSHFGVFDEKEVVQPMTAQKWYQNDAFGLRTLNEAGRVHMYTVPNITHHFWHVEQFIFDKYIRPWL